MGNQEMNLQNIAVIALGLLLLTTQFSFAEDWPAKSPQDHQRVVVLLTEVEQIIPKNDEGQPGARQLLDLAAAYGRWGDLENAERIWRQLPENLQGIAKCRVAEQLAKAGNIEAAEQLLDTLGDATTRLRRGEKVTDYREQAMTPILKARVKEVTSDQLLAKIRQSKSAKNQRMMIDQYCVKLAQEGQLDKLEKLVNAQFEDAKRRDRTWEMVAEDQAALGHFELAHRMLARIEDNNKQHWTFVDVANKQAAAGDVEGLLAAAASHKETSRRTYDIGHEIAARQLAVQGKPDEALAIIQKHLPPNLHTDAKATVISALANRGQLATAQQWFDQLNSAYWTPRLSPRLAMGYLKAGAYDKAMKQLQNLPDPPAGEAPSDKAKLLAEAAITCCELDQAKWAARFLDAAVKAANAMDIRINPDTNEPWAVDQRVKDQAWAAIAVAYAAVGNAEKVADALKQMTPADANRQAAFNQSMAIRRAGAWLVKNDQQPVVLTLTELLPSDTWRVNTMINIANQLRVEELLESPESPGS